MEGREQVQEAHVKVQRLGQQGLVVDRPWLEQQVLEDMLVLRLKVAAALPAWGRRALRPVTALLSEAAPRAQKP